jgi:hypothetical protein
MDSAFSVLHDLSSSLSNKKAVYILHVVVIETPNIGTATDSLRVLGCCVFIYAALSIFDAIKGNSRARILRRA